MSKNQFTPKDIQFLAKVAARDPTANILDERPGMFHYVRWPKERPDWKPGDPDQIELTEEGWKVLREYANGSDRERTDP